MYPIANTVCAQLNWTQYRLLIAISDDYKREYYELEAMNNCWTARELERQINSQLYERLLLSNDKESVLAVARKERHGSKDDVTRAQYIHSCQSVPAVSTLTGTARK